MTSTIWHYTLSLSNSNLLTEVGLRILTELALVTLRCILNRRMCLYKNLTLTDSVWKHVQCLAAVAWEAKKPLTIETIDVMPPRAEEVGIKVLYAGVCHTFFKYLQMTQATSRLKEPAEECYDTLDQVSYCYNTLDQVSCCYDTLDQASCCCNTLDQVSC
jgi:hypothetical protein